MKLFDELYEDIQGDLVKQLSGTESGIVRAYRVALESIQQDLAGLYRRYSKDGKLYWTEMNKYKRLQTLEASIRKALGKQLRGVDSYIEKQTIAAFSDSFYRHAWAIDQDAGFAFSWGGVPTEAVEAIVNSPLSKLADSPALAAARAGAINRVRNEITLSLVRGESYDKMSRRIGMVLGFDEDNQFMGRGEAYRSMRIARTEANRAMVQGQARTYEKARENEIVVEEYWDAALDDRTRAAHGRMDGEKRGPDGMFDTPVGKIPAPMTSGVPSFDINCRCRIRGQIPGYPPQTRYVRGEGSVPWISYEEWKRGLESGKFRGPVDKKARKALKKLKTQTKKAFSLPSIPDDARRVIHKMKDDITVELANTNSHYDRIDKKVVISQKKLSNTDEIGKTIRHEYGHAFDYAGKLTPKSAGDKFINAAKRGNKSISKRAKSQALREKTIEYVKAHKNDSGLSDFFCSMTKCGIMGAWGHPVAYYPNYARRTVEMFANLFDLYCRQDHWTWLEDNFSEITNEFKAILKELS